MTTATKRKPISRDQRVQTIPDEEQAEIVAEVWKSRTTGDPQITYHYFKVVRQYPMGKKTIQTDKFLPKHHAAAARVAELAYRESLRRDQELLAGADFKNVA
ncbi:MAG: hypothetical protein CMJ58_01370 [Planctomycetaceae bacterium]|nr:hypothetical protein [Planctomycetaceae bacterium]